MSKNLLKPPLYVDATDSHAISPRRVPPTLPATMATPVKRPQHMHNVIGTTAEPTRIPMNRYTHPRLSWKKKKKKKGKKRERSKIIGCSVSRKHSKKKKEKNPGKENNLLYQNGQSMEEHYFS